MTTLIADSGSTKTDWCLITENQSIQISTPGINPFFQNEQEIKQLLCEELLPKIQVSPINHIHFFGAGCIGKSACNLLYRPLHELFYTSDIEIASDLLGTARSLCGNRSGIACILGTGSNSCLYDGKNITRNIPPLGFILGDEGSGNSLGKRLISDCLKGILPTGITQQFLNKYHLTQADILQSVYQESFPNRYLASFTPFLSENIQVPEIRQLVEECFRAFFERNLQLYNIPNAEVHFTGSIAWHFKEILHRLSKQYGFIIKNITRRPIEGLIRYYETIY